MDHHEILRIFHDVIDLDYDTTGEAQKFLQFLQQQVWPSRENAPALIGTPHTKILEPADNHWHKEIHAMNHLTLPRRSRAPAMILAAFAGLMLSVTAVGAASAATAPSTDSRQVAFAGTAYLAEPNETVDIAGNLHLVTRLTGSEQTGWTLYWQSNLANTTGTGQTSGTRYVGSGADAGTVTLPPGPPTRSAQLQPTFTLIPPGPPTHPPSPIRLAAYLTYDEGGHLADVQVHIEGSFGTVD